MKPNSFSKLYSIFHEKNWHANPYHQRAFDALCNLIDNIKEDQRELVLELLDRYHWVKFNELEAGVIELIKQLETLSPEYEKVFIGPIVKKTDEGSVKSGHSATYLLKSLTPRAAKLRSAKPEFIDDYSKLKIGDKDVLVIVDDYIGSGGTVVTAVEELNKGYGIPLNKIIILVFAAQQKALERLSSFGARCLCHLILKRGISDYYGDDALPSKRETMEKIEKLLPKLNPDYSFGFKQTEALITFHRSPNNTFPIFWMNHSIDNIEYEAAFPR